MGEVVLITFIVFGLAIAIAIFAGVSVLVARLSSFLFPTASKGLVSVLASGILPGLLGALFLAALGNVLDENFRGPEVLGIALVGFVAVFALFIAWPLSFWLTKKALHKK